MRSPVMFWILCAACAGLVTTGCGHQPRDDRVPVKVVTDEEMRQMHETNRMMSVLEQEREDRPPPEPSGPID